MCNVSLAMSTYLMINCIAALNMDNVTYR